MQIGFSSCIISAHLLEMVCQTQACLRPVDVHVCSMFTPGYVSMPLKRILSQAQLRDTHMHTASKLRRAPEALNSLFATLTSNKSKMTVELECVDLAQDIFYLICRTYAIFPSQTRKKVQKGLSATDPFSLL